MNGLAAGAGLSIALACDMRIASTVAKFNAAFIRVGLTGGDMGSSWLLPRTVGLGIANELLLTGRVVEADEAARIGLANRVVPADQLLPEAVQLARTVMQLLAARSQAHQAGNPIMPRHRDQALAVLNSEMAEALETFLSGRRTRTPGT